MTHTRRYWFVPALALILCGCNRKEPAAQSEAKTGEGSQADRHDSSLGIRPSP